MTQYTRILVGLDLSEDSEQILSKACGLARTCDATIYVAHIIEPLAFAYGGDIPVDLSEAQNLMEEQTVKRLNALCTPHGISTSHQLVMLGHTSSSLHEIAEEKDIDLIAVGSHGRHGLAMLFGSTANGVIKGASCDVLAIRV